jgi:low affinity Fe/Cu permease
MTDPAVPGEGSAAAERSVAGKSGVPVPIPRHVHHRAKANENKAAGSGVSGGGNDNFFVRLAQTVADIFGNAYLLAFWLVWIFVWVGLDLVTAMKFDQNFALLLALTGIPQLPLGTAILVVSNVTQKTQDAISEAQGETLQHIADLTAAVKQINDEQLEILHHMHDGATSAPKPAAG